MPEMPVIYSIKEAPLIRDYKYLSSGTIFSRMLLAKRSFFSLHLRVSIQRSAFKMPAVSSQAGLQAPHEAILDGLLLAGVLPEDLLVIVLKHLNDRPVVVLHEVNVFWAPRASSIWQSYWELVFEHMAMVLDVILLLLLLLAVVLTEAPEALFLFFLLLLLLLPPSSSSPSSLHPVGSAPGELAP